MHTHREIARQVIIATACLVALGLFVTSNAQTVQKMATWPNGPVGRVNLIKGDERYSVDRLTLAPGRRSDPPGVTHPDPRDVVLVALTPGIVEVSPTGAAGAFEKGRVEVGKVWYFPAATHSPRTWGARRSTCWCCTSTSSRWNRHRLRGGRSGRRRPRVYCCRLSSSREMPDSGCDASSCSRAGERTHQE